MADTEQMRIFVAVADAGGFAAAARALGLSPPLVTRAVAGLERRLGVRLLHRTTRQVRLTEAGVHDCSDARRILAALAEAEAAVRGAQREPQGELRLTASVQFGRQHAAPLVRAFLAQYAQVQVHALFVDRVVDLLDEGFDIALRIAHLADSSFTAVRVGAVRCVVVAAPGNLAERGTPLAPSDLATHDAVGFAPTVSGGTAWRFATGPGAETLRESPPPRMRWQTNAGDATLDAARAGCGLVRALSYQVADDIAAGRLVRVLRAYEPPALPVQLVYPAGRHAAAKVRAFADFAAPRLRVALAALGD